MTVELIKLIVIGGLGVFAGIIMLILIRSKTAGKFKLSRDGVSFEKETESRTNHYYMTRNIQDLDVELKNRCRRITNNLRSKVMQEFYGIEHLCPIVQVALASSLRVPLYQSIEENGFKKKFTRSALGEYIAGLIEEIELDYKEYLYLARGSCYEEGNIMPDFDQLKKSIEAMLKTFWANKIIEQIIIICEKKIEVYDSHTVLFRDLGDAYMLNVINNCREKNRKYIEGLRD